MSAIVALVYFDGRDATRAEIDTMVASLVHRGPDGHGVWNDGAVALGHQMMWTTPESLKERLPRTDPTTNLAITADVRVDNRGDLITQLDITGPADEVTDSELVLRAYEKWGVRSLDQLIGDYAFAIWEPRQRRLFCARDRFAAKHFYYFHKPGVVFAMASEIKALLTLPFVPRELNELQVAYHLLPIYDDKVQSFYKEIFRCPASHSMSVTRDGIVFHPSWTPDLGRELRLRSDAEYAEALRALLGEAVRCRRRSAFPVGTMLSGGLDSSSITCLARAQAEQEGRGPLKSFSAVWPGIGSKYPKIDEQRYMDAVIAQGGIEAHFVDLDRVSPLREWQRMYWHQDSTLSAPNMYLDWAIFARAEAEGVRVLLGGTDGDTVIGYGYDEFETMARRGQWIRLWRQARALSQTMPRPSHSIKQLMWRRGLREAMPAGMKRLWRLLEQPGQAKASSQVLPDHWPRRPWNADFLERVGLEEALGALYAQVAPHRQTSKTAHWLAIADGMWSYILECFEKGSAAHHVEMRFPFFDRRVVEFSLALPAGQRLQGGYTRSSLRRAMEGILPPEVQWRVDKGNLSAGVCLNLLEYERSSLEWLIADESQVRDYVDIKGLRACYERYLSNPVGQQDDAFTLILTLGLGLWMSSVPQHRRRLESASAATSDCP